jgi:hypothetical protein
MQVVAEVDAKLYEEVRVLAMAEGLSMPSFLAAALQEAVNRRAGARAQQFSGAYGKGGLRDEVSDKTIDELVNATYDQ